MIAHDCKIIKTNTKLYVVKMEMNAVLKAGQNNY